MLLVCCMLGAQLAAAQCNSTVTMYPYNQDFEDMNAGWTTGGNNSDWAWGTPDKKILKSAASGIKCWITGGLSKSAYNDNELSYLQSPCFDISTLNYPYIRFHIFCDTEQDWDGANLQYSTDNGTTWKILGYAGQPEDCTNSGWYNIQRVRFINDQNGWSGTNITGDKWTIAQMQLPFSGGDHKQVIFRFYFGAGSKNNNYDGFGIDDFYMGEAPGADGLTLNYRCASDSIVSFTANASPCLSNLQWDFDDVASGAANVAAGAAVTHHFATTGNHLVQLTAYDNNGNGITTTRKVNIIALSTEVISTVPCAGGTALVKAVVQGDPSILYNYTWSTLPEITTAIASLPAGDFLLQVSGDHTCPAEEAIGISEPAPITPRLTIQQPDCNNSNGSIALLISGGTYPFTYNWQPVADTTSSVQNLGEGTYQTTITDNNGCTTTTSAVLHAATLQLHLSNDTAICYGQSLTLYPGAYNSYVWDDESHQPKRTIDKAGTYYVTVANAEGCTASDSITIINDCGDIYFPSAFTPNGDLLNDVYGPAGNIGLLKQYTLRIYNRLGSLIFNTSNPLQKWNGRNRNGVVTAGTYVYIAIYEYNRVKKATKGTLVLLL